MISFNYLVLNPSVKQGGSNNEKAGIYKKFALRKRGAK